MAGPGDATSTGAPAIERAMSLSRVLGKKRIDSSATLGCSSLAASKMLAEYAFCSGKGTWVTWVKELIKGVQSDEASGFMKHFLRGCCWDTEEPAAKGLGCPGSCRLCCGQHAE